MGDIVEKRYEVEDAAVEYRIGWFERDCETREDGIVILRGYAAVFDSPSEWLGFREVVAPGAFARSLQSGSDIKALVEHDPARIVGRTSNGSLEIGEDEHGLWVRITPNESSEGRDLTENVRTGLLSQMSIGFRVLAETWENRNGEEYRTLTEVDLVETSIVTDPAYTATSIGVAARSDGEVQPSDWATAIEAAVQKPEPEPDHSLLRAKISLLERV